jgi:hypothetical protein
MKVLKSRFTNTVTYQLRYVLLYIVIGALLLGAIIAMPTLLGMRLSEAERASALLSMDYDLTLVNFPYHLLQGLSIQLLGLTPLAIKLPSIILGVITATLLTLLLNRWFKNLAAFTTSALIVSSVAFLSLTSSGTPGILYMLFPVLMLWLGSQIIDEKPKMITVAALAVTTAVSLLIPYMIYFNVAMILLLVSHPHLRFSFRKVKPTVWMIAITMVAAVVAPLVFLVDSLDLWALIGPNLDMAQNVTNAWWQMVGFGEPLSWFALPVLALAVIGVYATFQEYHIARNHTVFVLLLVAILASLFFPPLFTITILLTAILVGNGLGFLIRIWRRIFPKNIYATMVGLVPLGAFCLLVAIGSISFFYIAPRTIASVHYSAHTDLQLLSENIESGDSLIITENAEFYARAFPDNAIVESANVGATRVISDRPLETSRRLERIVTNSSATASARFFIYR